MRCNIFYSEAQSARPQVSNRTPQRGINGHSADESGELRVLCYGEPLSCGGRFVCYGILEIIQGETEAFFQLNLWLPTEELAGFGDVGTPLFGIVLRKGFVSDFAF